jgi:hypothetical protein
MVDSQFGISDKAAFVTGTCAQGAAPSMRGARQRGAPAHDKKAAEAALK